MEKIRMMCQGRQALIIVFLTLGLTTPVAGFLLPDTGQTICYGDKGNIQPITCPSPGEQLAQDGSYRMIPPSYRENQDGTVTDNNTGLMWQQADDQSRRTWDESTLYCENLSLGGYTDWRLPLVNELATIVDYGQTNSLFVPSIPYPDIDWESASHHWSSSNYVTDPGYAWRTNYLGEINYADKSTGEYARCVRGTPLTFEDFVDNTDGTVTSENTGLIWQQDHSGPMKWGSALNYCESLSVGGFSDWRLPNAKELKSLTHESLYAPAIDPAFFPASSNAYMLWSSTTFWKDNDYAWSMHVKSGGMYRILSGVGGSFSGLKSEEASVRCVRYPSLSVDPPGLAFGIVGPGSSHSRVLTISNTGPTTAFVEPVGHPSPPFSIGSDGCSGQALPPSGSCSLTVTFAPTYEGVFSDQITVFPTNAVWLGGSTRSFLPGTAHSFSYIEGGDGTVTDNNTGLMWQQQPTDNVYNWYEASGTQSSSYNRKGKDVCGSLNLAGYTDWRLPTKKERHGLDRDTFPANLGSQYWTSTIFAGDPDSVWLNAYQYVAKSADYPVHCVRGAPLDFGDFLNNADGTVTDRATGLMWQKWVTGTSGPSPQLCEDAATGGFTNWRLPNLIELESITDDSRLQPAIDITVFPDMMSAFPHDYLVLWSSHDRCFVNFSEGNIECIDGLSLPLGCSMGVYTCSSAQLCVRQADLDFQEISVVPSSLDFGSVDTGVSQTQDITVSNTGTDDLLITAVVGPSSPFSVTVDGCSGQTLSDSASCTLTIAFAPGAEQTFSDSLTITSSDANNPNFLVDLTGIGVAPRATLTGTITDASSGTPLAGATVDVTDADGTYSTSTAANGSYSMTGLAAGPFGAVFSKAGYIPQTVNGTFVAGQTETIDQLLNQAPPLMISITSPAEGATFNSLPITVSGTVTNNASVTVNGTAATVTSGTFSASVDLTEGPNTVTAVAADSYGQNASDSINVVLITKGTITGTVTDSSTGLPLVSASVNVTDASSINHTTTTDIGGAYTLTGLSSGVFSGSVSNTFYTTEPISGSVAPGETVVVNTVLNPAPPVISNIAVTPVTMNYVSTAYFSWETDQLTTGLLEFGTTASYGNSFPISPAANIHNFVLSNLSAGTTYHFRITATNGTGLSTTTADQTFATGDPPSPISFQITSPSDGATLNQPNTTVKGHAYNLTGLETGVVVNGVVASVYGNGGDNNFVANGVPLQNGVNTINITATDTAGNTNTDSITVTADTAAPYIRLSANIESGLSPLETTLKIDGSFTFTESDILYSGPGTIDFLPGTSVEEYDIVITGEGVHTLTAEVPDDSSNLHSDSITIVVFDRTALDTMLANKWNDMKTALGAQDINGALSYYVGQSQTLYGDIFSALYNNLAQIAQEMQSIQLIYADNGVAKYRIRKNQVYGGQALSITHYIYFVLDENGIWRIERF